MTQMRLWVGLGGLVALVACGPQAGQVCSESQLDCDGDTSNGCEVSTSSDMGNCGGCGVVCGGDNTVAASCEQGTCVLECEPGFDDCDLNPANGCEAQIDSTAHCGGCYNACSGLNATGECVNSECITECSAGFGDCNSDMTDGCESDLLREQTCGACDMGCTGSCFAGECESCDGAIALASTSSEDAARAIGICDDLVAARWVLPDGNALSMAGEHTTKGWGILDNFGNNVSPRQGTQLLALSSGSARRPGDPDFTSTSLNKSYTSDHPQGFPKESPACPGTTTGEPHDGVGLEVELQVPEWAQGYAFDFSFYTNEWPTYICSQFNDFFVAMMDPVPEGQADGNVSFDTMGNPISVNNAFLSVCGCFGGPPCLAGGKSFDCALGTAELEGTGFETHASTGWLTTTAPAEPNTTITVRFAIYDSGDGILDSTVVVDNFRWLAAPPEVGTNPVE